MRSFEIFLFNILRCYSHCLHACCMSRIVHRKIFLEFSQLTVRCWKSHALSIFVATFGNMPRFFWFFLPFESSSSSPVPSPDPTLALLASPRRHENKILLVHLFNHRMFIQIYPSGQHRSIVLHILLQKIPHRFLRKTIQKNTLFE